MKGGKGLPIWFLNKFAWAWTCQTADLDTLVRIAAACNPQCLHIPHPMVKMCKQPTSIAPEKYLKGHLSSYQNVHYLY